jgi:hypothetical protein
MRQSRGCRLLLNLQQHLAHVRCVQPSAMLEKHLDGAGSIGPDREFERVDVSMIQGFEICTMLDQQLDDFRRCAGVQRAPSTYLLLAFAFAPLGEFFSSDASLGSSAFIANFLPHSCPSCIASAMINGCAFTSLCPPGDA